MIATGQQLRDQEDLAQYGENGPPIDGAPIFEMDRLHGPVGDWVRLVAPHTEASPAALYMCALNGIGAAIGSAPHTVLDGARHGTNLFVCLIGPTASGRKGTAVARTRSVLRATDPNFESRNIASGLSSGQGLIYHVRDARPARDGEKNGDAGVADKRLFVNEAEFAAVLRQMRKEGSTLSATLREAWDGNTLRTLTKNDAVRATGAHISILAQITPDELRVLVEDVDLLNGFLNRFLLIHCDRSQLLPFATEPDAADLAVVIRRLERALVSARGRGCVDALTPPARAWWLEHYEGLTTARPGRVGAATQRGAAQLRRLALLFALLDDAAAIDIVHMEAANEVWRYAAETAAYVFGKISRSDRATKLGDALRSAGPAGLDRSQIRVKVFGSNSVPAREIVAALTELQGAGVARMRSDSSTGGRPREVWTHIEHVAFSGPRIVGNEGNEGKKGERDASSGEDTSLTSQKSLHTANERAMSDRSEGGMGRKGQELQHSPVTAVLGNNGKYVSEPAVTRIPGTCLICGRTGLSNGAAVCFRGEHLTGSTNTAVLSAAETA